MPAAALLGVAFVITFTPFLPVNVAFAGRAMLHVVSDKLIPANHHHGNESEATYGLISGL